MHWHWSVLIGELCVRMDRHPRVARRSHHNHHHHQVQTRAFSPRERSHLFVLPVAMMSGERDAGSARRRRDRRLRSWLRHERMTVAAELSAALHHSRDGERELYVGLRVQKSDSSAVGDEEVHEAYVVPPEQK